MMVTHACNLIISALRRLRQEDCEFNASLGYTASPRLKNKKTQRDREALRLQCTL
jgi:hypothetical protein